MPLVVESNLGDRLSEAVEVVVARVAVVESRVMSLESNLGERLPEAVFDQLVMIEGPGEVEAERRYKKCQ